MRDETRKNPNSRNEVHGMKDVNDLMQAILEMDAAQRKASEKAKAERTARLAALDARKQARILRTARYYMTRYHISEDTPCRFDVVAVLGSNVRLIRDAFWCG